MIDGTLNPEEVKIEGIETDAERKAREVCFLPIIPIELSKVLICVIY